MYFQSNYWCKINPILLDFIFTQTWTKFLYTIIQFNDEIVEIYVM